MPRGGFRIGAGAKKGAKYRKRRDSDTIASEKISVCLFCGIEFKGRKRKYCTEECGVKSRCNKISVKTKLIKYKCLRCGKKFDGGKRIFCTRECQVLFYKETKAAFVEKICEVCGKKFLTQNNSKRCSGTCFGKVRSKRNAETRPTFYCKKCGKPFFRTKRPDGLRLYCSRRCAGVGSIGSGKPRRLGAGGNHRIRAKRMGVERETVRMIDVFKRDGWRCQICGKPTPKKNRGTRYHNAPELDHRIPMSKGGGHLYSNVQCACRKCNSVKGNKNNAGQLPLFQVAANR